ncbi:MAG: hypothetical protein A2Z48_09435 [Actinobacteria bacterium RBG_19FT_COMBO_70_19]|nr:MAG: hypothetical protein A2Z48_09435 [Actinobacteria bacterium RBG_19FT_COMBO_70_19]
MIVYVWRPLMVMSGSPIRMRRNPPTCSVCTSAGVPAEAVTESTSIGYTRSRVSSKRRRSGTSR